MMAEADYILDPTQLARIEGAHRGFLYQHLYAVACLLKVPGSATRRVVIEWNEDVELEADDRRTLIQVKHLGHKLRMSDIADNIGNFKRLQENSAASIRELHIVSSSEMGPELLKWVESSDRPANIGIATPTRHPTHPTIPQVMPTIDDLISYCSSLASKLPYLEVHPTNLVYKLTTLALRAGSGAEHHTFEASALPDLFNQTIRRLQRLPPAPVPYRTFRSDITFLSEERINIVVGLSGSGKTSWIGQNTNHEPDGFAYVDLAGIPTQGAAEYVAREMAAVFIDSYSQKYGELFTPGRSGLDLVQIVDAVVSETSRPIAIIDNAHLGAEILPGIVQRARMTKWILLAQPGTAIASLATRLSVVPQEMPPWSHDAIVREFSDLRLPFKPRDIETVLNLTAGLPLLVAGLARYVRDHYGGNIDAASTALVHSLHDTITPQELLLDEVFRRSSEPATCVTQILMLADTPMSSSELVEVSQYSHGKLRNTEAMAAVRELRSNGILREAEHNQFHIHDAFRVLASRRAADLSLKDATTTRKALVKILEPTRESPGGVKRLLSFLKLLPLVGQTKTLVDVVSNAPEIFYEQGLSSSMQDLMDYAVAHTTDPDDRVSALDALAYWQFQTGDKSRLQETVSKMQAVVEPGLSADSRASVLLKRMASNQYEDPRDLDSDYRAAISLATTPSARRVVRYSYAISLLMMGEIVRAEVLLSTLMEEYFGLLGLTFELMLAQSPQSIRDRIVDRDSLPNWDDEGCGSFPAEKYVTSPIT